MSWRKTALSAMKRCSAISRPSAPPTVAGGKGEMRSRKRNARAPFECIRSASIGELNTNYCNVYFPILIDRLNGGGYFASIGRWLPTVSHDLTFANSKPC